MALQIEMEEMEDGWEMTTNRRQGTVFRGDAVRLADHRFAPGRARLQPQARPRSHLCSQRSGLLMDLNRDQQRIVDLATALYGRDWQSSFSRATTISQTLLSMIANGTRPVTEATHAKVISGLKAEVKKIRRRAAEVAAAVSKYERD